MPLLLINHQITAEVLDLLYGTIPFTIDIRKDGTFMCGRRLLEAKPAEGGPFHQMPAADDSLEKFLKAFRFGAVKKYVVDILVENRQHTAPSMGVMGGPRRRQPWWSEEVELYDLRDYVSVAVSGILSKATDLSRLTVRVGVAGFNWSEEVLVSNLQTVVEPFTRLRKVVQPKLLEVYDGQIVGNYSWMVPLSNTSASLYSVPSLPTQKLLLSQASPELNQAFNDYKKTWERTISQNAPPPPRPPIRAMFSELKNFYTKLHQFIPNIYRSGQKSFLHRARVAREKEDVLAFREVRNELIGYWNQYLDEEEQKKKDMNKKLCQMLDTDSYPSEEAEDEGSVPPHEPGSPDYLELLQAADENPGFSAQRWNVKQLRRQLLIQRQMVFKLQQAQQKAQLQAAQRAEQRITMMSSRCPPPPTALPAGFPHSNHPTFEADGSLRPESSAAESSSSANKQVEVCSSPLSPLGNPDTSLSPLLGDNDELFQPLPLYELQPPAQTAQRLHLQQHQLALQARLQVRPQQWQMQAQAQAQAQAAQAENQPLAKSYTHLLAAYASTPGKREAEVDLFRPAKRQQTAGLEDSSDGVIFGEPKGKGKAVCIEIDDCSDILDAAG
jgi:hypothetical protein